MELFRLKETEMFVAGTEKSISIATGETIKAENYAILFCNNGLACIEIDFNKHYITRGTQVIITAGKYVKCIEFSKDFCCSFILFKSAIYDEVTSRLEPSFTYFLKEYPCVKLSSKNVKKITIVMQMIEEFYNDKDNCFRLEIFKNYIQSLLLDIYDKTRTHFKIDKSAFIGRKEELFIKFIHLIHKHSPKEREVSFYAEQLYITPRYLSSIVQSIAGCTAKSIIDKHSIQAIKVMLKSDNKSIQNISYDLKFPDQSFFARYFKKHTGMSPVEYRLR